jgi:AraC-like DNA-binding protein
MRQPGPDGSVVVRTYPLTFLHDHTEPSHAHDWDQLTYAASGVMRVETDRATWLVPPHRAVWVPAGVRHAERMHSPVSVRTLYLAPRLARSLPRDCGMVNISPLLREVVLHVSRLGALDRKRPSHRGLIRVLLDQLESQPGEALQLPLPRDARARRVAALLQDRPDESLTVARLARRAGVSRRTMERLFLAETRMTVGEWRRRLRLLHAVHRLAGGESVTSAALEAGYASTSAFISVFRKAFGTTPGRYGPRRGSAPFDFAQGKP